MNEIGYFSLIKEEVKEFEKIKKLISFALEKEQVNNVEFNIILVDNNKIREINKNYRNIDSETDVISFALEDYKEDLHLLSKRLLGDIYISYEKVLEQALKYNHSILRELAFLSIHGLLHLLGYNHIDENDEKIMFEKQELILNEFGITK